MAQKYFVAIAGNIGTGKTTLTHLLSEKLGWISHFEAVSQNPYLADFYRDMSRWSFPLQVYFLTRRYEAHQKIASGPSSAIQDRSIYEDANIFARNLFEQGQMEKRDYHNYLDLYQTMCASLHPPDLVVYLRKSLPTLKSRISMRGRDFEREIPDEYLGNLNKYYDDWMEGYSLGKKLIVPSDSLDFLNNSDHFENLIENIKQNLPESDEVVRRRHEVEPDQPDYEGPVRSIGLITRSDGLQYRANRGRSGN